MPQLRLAPAASADTIQWPNIGHADEYAASFRCAGGSDGPEWAESTPPAWPGLLDLHRQILAS